MIPAIRFQSHWWIAVLLSVAVPVAAHAEEGEAVSAQWRSYEITFNYSSMYTYYNCYSFEDKLEQMLKQLGAKPDVRVTTSGCFGGHDLGNMLTSRIRVQMPVASDAGGESFSAGYRPVTLTTRDSMDMGRSGDCELLDEVRRQLVPALHLSVTKDDVHCFPGQPTLNPQTLEIKALVATPVKN